MPENNDAVRRPQNDQPRQDDRNQNQGNNQNNNNNNDFWKWLVGIGTAGLLAWLFICRCDVCKRKPCRDCEKPKTENVTNNYYTGPYVNGDGNIVNRDGVIDYQNVETSGSGKTSVSKESHINVNNGDTQEVKTSPTKVIKQEPKKEEKKEEQKDPCEDCEEVTTIVYQHTSFTGSPEQVMMLLKERGYNH